MEARSSQKYIIMSPRKIRRVINQVRGKCAVKASEILEFMPYAAAVIVNKNLKAAIANAGQKYGAQPEDLFISEIMADEGPTYKRFKPRAQGRIYMRMKRTAHLTVAVSMKDKSKKY